MLYRLPNTPLFCPETFSISVVGNIQINTSPLNGMMQTVEFPGDRRLFTLQYGPHHNSELAPLRAFWNRFRGQAHLLQLWNLAQPTPRGTLVNGVCAAAPAGANSVVITGQSGATLLPGDWIGLQTTPGSMQTVEVAEASGTTVITAHVNPPLRQAVSANAPVYTNSPGITCILTAAPVIPHGKGSIHGLGVSDGFTVEAVEFLGVI